MLLVLSPWEQLIDAAIGCAIFGVLFFAIIYFVKWRYRNR